MPSSESRLAQVEQKVNEHDSIIAELRVSATEFKEFRKEVRGSFQEVHESFREVRGEIHALRDKMDRRFEQMDQKIDRHFMWTIALLATVLLSIVGSVVTMAVTLSR
ncbi:MAG: hypothetical protein HYU37_19545 [Acidobacteria bacterium]|nr:hypothetical protein [Acidobacteriota bacterium]